MKIKVFTLETDLLLVFCTDQRSRSESLLRKINQFPFDWEYVFRKFEENKISCQALLQVLPLVPSLRLFESKIQSQIQMERIHEEKYIALARLTNDLLSRSDVNHVMIKIIECPWAYSVDFDVLAEPIEELKALEALHKEGFTFFQFRLLADSLKIMAKKSSYNGIAIDFYPEPAWIRKKVSTVEEISSRKRNKRIYGVNMNIPSAEDNILLVASHSYNHLNFLLPEILHGINLISDTKIDWSYLISASKKNGVLHATFAYLCLINEYSSRFYGDVLVPKEAIELFRRHSVCKILEKWFEKRKSTDVCFPVRIPFQWGIFLSLIYRALNTARKGDGGLVNEVLAHMLALSSKLVRGFT